MHAVASCVCVCVSVCVCVDRYGLAFAVWHTTENMKGPRMCGAVCCTVTMVGMVWPRPAFAASAPLHSDIQAGPCRARGLHTAPFRTQVQGAGLKG